MRKSKVEQKAIIMGGGLAGLTAGFELAKKGVKVEVVEKCDQVGGLAKTIEVNNFRFDTGPHRWYAKNDEINQWMIDLLRKELIRVPRLTRIYFDKKFFYYPIRLGNALLGIGPWKAFKSVIDYLLVRIKSKIARPRLLTMEDGYINQFGRTLYEVFFKRYSEKLWGQDCSSISIDWVGQRTRGLDIFTILKETFLKSKNIVSLVDEFSYPKNGIGRIAEKLSEEIRKRKGAVYTNSEVIEVRYNKKRIESVVVDNKGKRRIISGDYFISSIPLSDLIISLKPTVKVDILHLASRLKFRDEIQIALFAKKTHITADTWIYIHPKEIPFMRVMEMDNWSNQLSPENTTTLVFEIACNEDDRLWKKQDEEIIDLVINAYIKEFGTVEKKDILGGYVYRAPKEYPIYHLGYRKDVGEIKAYLKRFENLQIIGRAGTFRYNNMDHSIEMGLYAAWNILSGKDKYDIESVNIEREYLEEKKIENIEDELVEGKEKVG